MMDVASVSSLSSVSPAAQVLSRKLVLIFMNFYSEYPWFSKIYFDRVKFAMFI